jgi:hypothetical protein
VSMGVRLFPAVHGHIADSLRDGNRDRAADLPKVLPPPESVVVISASSEGACLGALLRDAVHPSPARSLPVEA